MTRRKKIATLATLVGLIVLYIVLSNRSFKEDELAVNGLVYLKKTGVLFSGTMKVGDYQHSGAYSYSKGEPYGHFISKDFGSVTAEGTYLDKSILPTDAHKIIGKRMFAISLWNEGPFHVHNPMALTLQILEPDWGKFEFKNYAHIDEIANSLAKETKQLNYRFLEIRFVSDFGYHAAYWYNVTYSMDNKVPELTRRDSI